MLLRYKSAADAKRAYVQSKAAIVAVEAYHLQSNTHKVLLALPPRRHASTPPAVVVSPSGGWHADGRRRRAKMCIIDRPFPSSGEAIMAGGVANRRKPAPKRIPPEGQVTQLPCQCA